MYCGKCGSQVITGEKFCGSCGEAVNMSPAPQSNLAPVYQQNPTPTYQQAPTQSISNFKPLCLVAIIICAILWLVAPFIAINLLTLGDQPSALQLIANDITYIGELTESTAFWAAVVSLIGIIICFFCTIGKKNTATRVIAIITEIPLIIALIEILSWTNGDIEDIFKALGIGFWGIFILLWVVVFASGKKRVVSNQPQQTYPAMGVYTQPNPAPSATQMGGIPVFYFNGKEYLTIDDENRFLELANKGITSAQHGLGLFYITQRNDMDKALYWFCVAEYNGEEQATSDLNYIVSTYPNQEWLNQRIAYHRGEVSRNPVYKETLDDIFKEMAQDPNLRR